MARRAMPKFTPLKLYFEPGFCMHASQLKDAEYRTNVGLVSGIEGGKA